jgi:hypothetical protein
LYSSWRWIYSSIKILLEGVVEKVRIETEITLKTKYEKITLERRNLVVTIKKKGFKRSC